MSTMGKVTKSKFKNIGSNKKVQCILRFFKSYSKQVDLTKATSAQCSRECPIPLFILGTSCIDCPYSVRSSVCSRFQGSRIAYIIIGRKRSNG